MTAGNFLRPGNLVAFVLAAAALIGDPLGYGVARAAGWSATQARVAAPRRSPGAAVRTHTTPSNHVALMASHPAVARTPTGPVRAHGFAAIALPTMSRRGLAHPLASQHPRAMMGPMRASHPGFRRHAMTFQHPAPTSAPGRKLAAQRAIPLLQRGQAKR